MLLTLTRLALVISLVPFSSAQNKVAPAQDSSPRPVKDITPQPSATEVEFYDLNFQAPAFLHAGPGLAPIDGQPVAGSEYVIEAYLKGEQVIARMRFQMVDQSGAIIAPLAIVRHMKSGFPRYVGVVTVPSQPFRVVLIGETVTGEPFRREYRKLIRPLDREPSRRNIPAAPADEWGALIERSIAEAGPQLINDVKTDVGTDPNGHILMPRMDISNVSYAPLYSAQGRPIGIRIAYDAKFSETSQYNPAVKVTAKYDNQEWHSRTRMEVLDSTITPMPREAHAPFAPVTLNDIRTSPMQAGATYTYDAGTVYHFTADLVPDFIVHNLDNSKACIYYQKNRYSKWAQKPFEEILSYEGPTTYSVITGDRRGVVENFFSEGTILRSFVAEGAPDCGPQPTRRF